jgi:hypothetical protein
VRDRRRPPSSSSSSSPPPPSVDRSIDIDDVRDSIAIATPIDRYATSMEPAQT